MNSSPSLVESSSRTLFLAWQDPEERRWFTVGRLDHTEQRYVFRYTKGAEDAQKRGFSPIVSFPSLRTTYESKDIFPLFANQVLPRSRPEFDDYIEWLSIPKDKADPVAILARAGEQVANTLEIFPYPQKQPEGSFTVHFFVRGLRYQSSCSIDRVKTLQPDEELLLLPDVQNPYDPDACLLRTAEQHEQDMHLLGYLPRYLAGEFAQLSREEMAASSVEVVRVNPSPAPIHFRILCRLTMDWEQDAVPFDARVYQPIDAA
jgi:hypothetical protein